MRVQWSAAQRRIGDSLYGRIHVIKRQEEKVSLSIWPCTQLTSSSDFLLFICTKKCEGKKTALNTAIDTEIIRSQDANMNYIAINQSNNR